MSKDDKRHIWWTFVVCGAGMAVVIVGVIHLLSMTH